MARQGAEPRAPAPDPGASIPVRATRTIVRIHGSDPDHEDVTVVVPQGTAGRALTADLTGLLTVEWADVVMSPSTVTGAAGGIEHNWKLGDIAPDDVITVEPPK